MKAGALIPLAVLALAGCSGGRPPASSQAANTQAACPASDFPGFVEAFMADEKVQRQYIRMPLTTLTMREGPEEGEPIGFETLLTADKLPRPLIPTRAQQAKAGLVLEIHNPETDYPSIRINKPGTNPETIYRFEKTADCWRLTVMQS